jgi:16S rRNA processing protein RimM
VSDSDDEIGLVGRISGVFGIKGWVKLASFTEPEENIFEYSPWWIRSKNRGKHADKSVWREIKIDRKQRHKDGWIVHIEGVDDRDEAETYKFADIGVERSQFAELEDGEFYWHELLQLRVKVEQAGSNELIDIGHVAELMETGANDVLVVRSDDNSVDDNERLVPYVPELYVLSVDLEKQQIVVNWDIDD